MHLETFTITFFHFAPVFDASASFIDFLMFSSTFRISFWMRSTFFLSQMSGRLWRNESTNALLMVCCRGLGCCSFYMVFLSTSQTAHLFLCFAPQMAQLGFFIERGIFPSLQFFLPPYAADSHQESYSSYLESGRFTDWTTAAAARTLKHDMNS